MKIGSRGRRRSQCETPDRVHRLDQRPRAGHRHGLLRLGLALSRHGGSAKPPHARPDCALQRGCKTDRSGRPPPAIRCAMSDRASARWLCRPATAPTARTLPFTREFLAEMLGVRRATDFGCGREIRGSRPDQDPSRPDQAARSRRRLAEGERAAAYGFIPQAHRPAEYRSNRGDRANGRDDQRHAGGMAGSRLRPQVMIDYRIYRLDRGGPRCRSAKGHLLRDRAGGRIERARQNADGVHRGIVGGLHLVRRFETEK